MSTTALTTCLWFDTQAEEAAKFYCDVFPDSQVTSVTRNSESAPGETGAALTVEFTLRGQPFVGLNGGPVFHFTEAISFQISCADQAEVDYYWSRLTDGGRESNCGWCQDRYGLSWQVIPTALPRLLGDPDPGRANRAMQAMLAMHKLDVAALEAAADGEIH